MPLEGEYEPSTQKWVRDNVDQIERSGGTEGMEFNGMHIILMTNKGAKSGKIRKTPLMRVEHDGTYAVVASQGGAPTHPLWYYNLQANPLVELQDKTVTQDMVARELDGDERAAWWKRAVAAYPDYADYQTKTDRLIPVFVLEPVNAA
jgi:deazaflavin-dependent oxidoreductase (nitroreductase family)